MTNLKKKLVITGGHHTSALPVIKLLQQLYPDLNLTWFGHKATLLNETATTLEYLEISALGIDFVELHAGKLYRTYNLKRLLKIPFGFVQAFWLLIKIRPVLILSFGGYLAAPVVIAGKLLGIPSITHEQTVTLGYANKIIAKFADKIMISWPSSAVYFPKAKVVYTGLPLRSEITTVLSTNFSKLNPKLPTIYITGGKTGSRVLNFAVLEALKDLLTMANIIHQCGTSSLYDYVGLLTAKYSNLKSSSVTKGIYYPTTFVTLNEIGEVFAKCDLVVSRAGAHIVCEILALEKPSLLIPIPWVSHNEQTENAKLVKTSGLGEIMLESDLTPANLTSQVEVMLKNLSQYTLKDKAVKPVFSSNSAAKIVGIISTYL